MSDERRLRKRVNLSVYLATTDAAIGRPMGNIIDLSAAGFKLLTDQSISQTGEVSINIELPTPIENLNFINVIAKFIRSSPSANPLYHECAFEITYTSSQNKRIIEEVQQHWNLNFPSSY